AGSLSGFQACSPLVSGTCSGFAVCSPFVSGTCSGSLRCTASAGFPSPALLPASGDAPDFPDSS
ncbi:MAG TPA: hypothetical protein DCP64_13945, partial [Sarcina sp.]|nr:hypothetical protein [Sarcina sp.]